MLCPRLNVTRYARSRGSELRSLLTLRWRRQSGANSSLLKIPCLQGKEQGIFAESQFSRALERQNRQLHQSLTAQFPTHPNREFFAAQQGIESGEQGNFRLSSGNSISSGFWTISGL